MVNKKIYVSIASYRDPFLQRTIDSLYCTARNPENITVGCFVQAFPEELPTLVPLNRYGYSVYYETQQPGTVFSVTECRNKCLKWLDSSYDYVLQVDSHTTFDVGWDTFLIEFICKLNDEKAILSSILPTFGVKSDGNEVWVKQDAIRVVYPDEQVTKYAFMNSYDIVFPIKFGKPLANKDYANGWYLSGHFIFSSSKYFLQIPQPSWVLFWGEEVVNSIRAYTAGWNVYIPEKLPLYHLDQNITEIDRPRLWQDFPEQWSPRREFTTDKIVDIMNNLNIDSGDIFYERTLEELYLHIGEDLGKLFQEWRTERRARLNR